MINYQSLRLRFFFSIMMFMMLAFSSSFDAKAQEFVNGVSFILPAVNDDSVRKRLPLSPYISFTATTDFCSSDKSYSNKSLLTRKLLHEHLLKADSADYVLVIDPALLFSVGQEISYSHRLYENTRGIRISGNLHRKLIFDSEIYETQTVLPSYLEAFADSFQVAPGLMRAKEFKQNGRDISAVYGKIAWTPVRDIHLILGRDKQHFGYGYRSLMLSHHAPAATFLRTEIHRKNWSYVFSLASFQNLPLSGVLDVPQSSLGGFQNKYANFIMLSYSPLRNIHLSVFESMMWAPFNDKYNSLHWKHFNPLPFSRTAFYGTNNRNNSMTGLQIAVQLPLSVLFYSQYVLDDIGTMDRAAFQAGLQYKRVSECDLFSARLEYNTVGAYTYAHENPLQSYSHYHHSLAHPLGANFREMLLQVSYHYRKWGGFAMFSYVRGGPDSPLGTSGQSIYANPANVVWSGGLFPVLTTDHASIIFADVRLHYLINPVSGLNVFVNGTFRKIENTMFPQQSTEFSIGLSSSLRFYCKHISWL